jgi:hypothetical protein
MQRATTHCGRCSQCIDRRFAVLAADAADYEPASLYAVDLMEGARSEGVDRTMAEAFVRSRLEMSRMTDSQYLGRYGLEIATICGSVRDLTSGVTGQRLISLHRRHGGEVAEVVESAIKQRTHELVRGDLPDSSILMMAISPRKAASLLPADEGPATPEERQSVSRPPKVPRTKPALSRANAALAALFPKGVPPQDELPNVLLCRAVALWLKNKPAVSDDTVLRAAGRRI